MTVTCPPFKLASILFVLLPILAAQAQEATGPVSSTVTRPAASATSTPTTSDDKPLPWKFLASPMGVLDPTEGPKVDRANPAAKSETWGDVMTGLGDCSDPQKLSTASANVEKLVKGTIGIDLTQSKKATYVVIHVVDYPTSTEKAASDAWYLYRSAKANWGDPKWDCQKYTGQRIYGAPSVLFLFVHLHARAVSLAKAREQLRKLLENAKDSDALGKSLKSVKQKQITERLSDEQIDNALDNALKTNALLIDSPDSKFKTLTFCDKDSGDQFQWFGRAGVPGSYDGVPSTYANVRYESAVVKRTPANIANLKTILGLLFGAQSKNESCLDVTSDKDAIVWGAGRIEHIGLPSDISIAGYTKKPGDVLKDEDRAGAQIGAMGSYNDEQLYWWDAGIGIPVHKIKDLQYSDSNDTVVASQVDRQSAYAMFNLMLHPVDLSGPGSNIWPRILVGFPLASSPWDKLFAGAGIGIPLKPFQDFQFFVGSTFIRSKQPSTLAAGSSATDAQLQNDLRLKTTPKFTFGINVPVKSVVDKLRK